MEANHARRYHPTTAVGGGPQDLRPQGVPGLSRHTIGPVGEGVHLYPPLEGAGRCHTTADDGVHQEDPKAGEALIRRRPDVPPVPRPAPALQG